MIIDHLDGNLHRPCHVYLNNTLAFRPYSTGMVGKLKNSKICKDLQPINNYHCAMSAEQLEKHFSVQIKQLPERRIAYIRVTDAFKEGKVINEFAKLIDWSKDIDLYKSETIFGMSKDDPEVTPKEKYRYEACITLPKDFKLASDSPVQTAILRQPVSTLLPKYRGL
ncbi:GyrI-like domain-containing protein [Pedobacter sp. N36a]|uniref:GyrI-like domain-containing protein n=1 Tax=Pedobacter sp. N36a TaxID=2767996 RepID=UPI0016573062|nr:GyrI-like domain-containing protein [Pedobacter sp. N36a]MBC8988468.1 GyrI-like domain-containing protein [Pedobacter sp. N36a]